MKRKIFLSGIFLGLILIQNKALAYIDPSTGGMAVQIVIALFAGIMCTLGVLKDKIINFFKKK